MMVILLSLFVMRFVAIPAPHCCCRYTVTLLKFPSLWWVLLEWNLNSPSILCRLPTTGWCCFALFIAVLSQCMMLTRTGHCLPYLGFVCRCCAHFSGSNNTLLHMAAMGGHVSMVQALITMHANVRAVNHEYENCCCRLVASAQGGVGRLGTREPHIF